MAIDSSYEPNFDRDDQYSEPCDTCKYRENITDERRLKGLTMIYRGLLMRSLEYLRHCEATCENGECTLYYDIKEVLSQT
jgi:hypothetical protein